MAAVAPPHFGSEEYVPSLNAEEPANTPSSCSLRYLLDNRVGLLLTRGQYNGLWVTNSMGGYHFLPLRANSRTLAILLKKLNSPRITAL